MAGRISKQGKKFTGTHTSYTELAGRTADVLAQDPRVRKISAGIIKTNLPNQQGRNRIKVIDEGSCVLLRIRGNISQQEVRVYGLDEDGARSLLQRFIEKSTANIEIVYSNTN